MVAFEAGKVVKGALSSDTYVTNLLGGNKIFANIVPDADNNGQGKEFEMPYIVYTRTQTRNDNSKACDVLQPTMAIECWAKEYDTAIDIAMAVYNAMSSAKGLVNGIRVSEVRFEDGFEASDGKGYMQMLIFKMR